MKKYIAFTILILVLMFSWTTGFAQESNPESITDNQVNAVAKQLYCPVCENIPLDVCGTQACADWREEIRQKLAEGWDEDEIKQYFVDRFGDRVLATPPARGLNWIVYIVPPAAFLAGVFILYRGLKSWRELADEPNEVEESKQEIDDDYIARLEEELKKQ
jgi:cytochrome c-type biogenesis protein CcmH